MLINYNKTLSADLYTQNKNTESQSIVRTFRIFLSLLLTNIMILFGYFDSDYEGETVWGHPFLMAMAMATF
jgi:hypothetical protein